MISMAGSTSHTHFVIVVYVIHVRCLVHVHCTFNCLYFWAERMMMAASVCVCHNQQHIGAEEQNLYLRKWGRAGCTILS